MLNNCEIRDKTARDQWFDRTVNVHSKQQKEADKGYGETLESGTDVSVYSKKISGWSG